MSSAARNVLTKRAVSCSFASVFYLENAGMPKKNFEYIKKIFICTIVAPPVVLLGIASTYSLAKSYEYYPKFQQQNIHENSVE